MNDNDVSAIIMRLITITMMIIDRINDYVTRNSFLIGMIIQYRANRISMKTNVISYWESQGNDYGNNYFVLVPPR